MSDTGASDKPSPVSVPESVSTPRFHGILRENRDKGAIDVRTFRQK